MAETADLRGAEADFFKLGVEKLWMDYTESRMGGDLIYHYRRKELVGVTVLHAKGPYCQPGH